ncbi:MAG: hypothetical protein LC795_02265 [Acidobacteria bacterium]|nr:hypothetical protein [Acidobacteriota bacterium]
MAVFADRLVMALAVAVLLVLAAYALFPDDYTQRLILMASALVIAGGLSLWVVPKWQVASLRGISDAARFGHENEARRAPTCAWTITATPTTTLPKSTRARSG